MRNPNLRFWPLAGTMLALLLLGGQVVNAAAAAAIPMPPGGPGVAVTKHPRIDPAQLQSGAPLWPWLVAAAFGIVFIILPAVANARRTRVRPSGRPHPQAFLRDAHRPSTTG